MPLHRGQKRYIERRLALGRKINILTCANRWGKSTLIAVLQIWYNFYKIGIAEAGDTEEELNAWSRQEYRTANIAPHSANTEAVFKTIHQILTSSFSYLNKETGKLTNNNCLIEWFYLKDKTLNTPPYKQFFSNNSYIEHRSLGGDQGDALQGKPYGWVSYDEGGRSNHLELEVTGGILPRLFDWGGPLDIISTPSSDSKSGIYYYQLYQDGLVGIHSTFTMEGTLRDNTFFTTKQIDDQYELYKDDPLGPQVLEGKFVFGGDTVFDQDSILDARDESLNDGIRYEDGHKYCIGIDTAIGSDEIVFSCLDITTKPFRLVREVAAKGNSRSPQMHQMVLLDLIESYYRENNMFIILETWNGESVRFYMDLPPWVQLMTVVYGSWSPNKLKTDNENEIKARPNSSKKADILISLRKLLSARELKIPFNDQRLIDQLAIYREDDSKLQTDRVMALALAAHRATEAQILMAPAFQNFAW